MAQVRVSIVFESGARIGPGKAKLLESIRDTGSISAAARDMGMSYKRAWLLLDSMNQAFGARGPLSGPAQSPRFRPVLPRPSSLLPDGRYRASGSVTCQQCGSRAS